MKVVFFFADSFNEMNSSYWTAVVPHNAIMAQGHESSIMHIQHWLDNNPRARFDTATADAIILQRVLLDESAAVAKKWPNKRILVSFDDAYHLIAEENAAFKFWGKGEVEVNTGGYKWKKQLSEHPVQQFINNLPNITGGITPGRVLADDYRAYAPMIHLPNYIESSRYTNLRKWRGKKKTIGWGGSLSHLTSFSHSGAQDALRAILSNNHEWQFGLVGDQRLIKQLALPEDQLWFRNYVILFDWPSVLCSFDIGIAPLALPYDQRRSRLKVMEYIALGIPFVATRSAVYEDFFDCKSGVFVNQGALTVCDKPNTKGWKDALQEVIDNYDDYVAIAAKEKERYYDMYDSMVNAPTIVEKVFYE